MIASSGATPEGNRRSKTVASFQETAERAQACERAHQRSAADVFGAPRREERANIGGRQRGELPQRRRAAEMLGEKAQELQDVAAVGFDRFCRQPPFGGKMPQPGLDLCRYFGGNRVVFQGLRHVPLCFRGNERREYPTRLYPS